MSSSRQIVIDDTDPSIVYTGQGWFPDLGTQDTVGNFGQTYLHTQHGTDANNSFVFSFEGTSIAVSGTTALKQIQGPNNVTTYDPTWECFVDGQSIGSTQPFIYAENNWLLCDKTGLTDGPHVLTLNVTTMGTTFWFDFLQFTPPPNKSYGNGSNVMSLSNLDPGIEYLTGWGPLGSTANCTTVPGSQAIFNFTGTSLTWVGFVPTELSHNASSASYSIDGGARTTFRLNGLAPDATTTIYNQIFFSTPELSPGPHTLLVTYLGSGSETPLVLSNIFFTNVTIPPPSSSSSSSSSSRTSANPNLSSGSGIAAGGHTSSRIGAIVGGVVGGVGGFLILLTLVLFLFFTRRRRRRQEQTRPSLSNVTPLLTSGYDPSSSSSVHPSDSASAAQLVPPLPPPMRSTPHQSYGNLPLTKSNLSLTHSHTAANSSGGSVSRGQNNSAATSTNLQSPLQPFRSPQSGVSMPAPVQTPEQETPGRSLPPIDTFFHRHEDSGLRMTQAESGAISLELPPAYTPS
ncbi:hypothetical protein AX15_005907 [Amanita polypyramis BW_CC]|nr:hypothetical protein AX15_005907 [Amanita polypyramis BW_CC]